MKQNFIKTSDSETASKMINLGFQKIDQQNGIYTIVVDYSILDNV